jgi:hypothetical protein
MRPYTHAIWHPESVNRGDVLVDPLFGEVVVESVFFQDGEWHFTTSARQHEPA